MSKSMALATITDEDWAEVVALIDDPGDATLAMAFSPEARAETVNQALVNADFYREWLLLAIKQEIEELKHKE